MQAHADGAPVPYVRHGTAQQHPGLWKCRLDSKSVGYCDRAVSANSLRWDIAFKVGLLAWRMLLLDAHTFAHYHKGHSDNLQRVYI
jgi:hypothetical protein